MNLQQLRYLREILRSDLSISEAARRLHTSQPGVSRQLRQLEEEFNVSLFIRQRNALSAVNPEARSIIDLALRISDDLDHLLRIGRERRAGLPEISVAAGHTMARYLLPQALQRFSATHADTRVTLVNVEPLEGLQAVQNGQSHLAVTTEVNDRFDKLVYVPCYLLPRILIAPPDHPLASVEPLTLQALAAYPMVAYDRAFTGRNILENAFARSGLTPNVVINAIGVDLVKSCVRNGLGIAIITRLSLSEEDKASLCVRSVDHLFQPTVVYVAFDKRSSLPATARNFLLAFAPHLKDADLERLLTGDTGEALVRLCVYGNDDPWKSGPAQTGDIMKSRA